MPTYDYECLKCNHTFEEFQKMSDDVLTKCPECKGKLKRLIGAGLGPIFKGSGFYQTDYKNSPKKAKQTEKKKTDTKSKDSKPKKTSKKD
ncbi:MAG: FmdB family zinc ribbon protein [Melioribacteraceae bacterium]